MTTPDTRPRCGGTPGNPGLLCMQYGIYHPQTNHIDSCECPGCSDCDQPAPTSGDSEELRFATDEARRELLAGRPAGAEWIAGVPRGDLDLFERNIRAESAAELREARDALEVTMFNAGQFKRRAEAAEQRLREVEERLLLIGESTEQIAYQVAASRPVPADDFRCFNGCHGCPEDDHHFGQSYTDYAASLINDEPAMYAWDGRMPNPCSNCLSCGRDPETGE